MIYRVGRCDVANFVENEVFVFHGGILHQENSEQITTMMVLILKFERVLR